MTGGALVVEGNAVAFVAGDSIALALLRAGLHPGGGGGPVCLAGDCPSCLCVVDGVPYTRACQTPARAGAVVVRQRPDDAPPAPAPGTRRTPSLVHRHGDVVVIGQGAAGRAAADEARAAGLAVYTVDARDADEAIGVYESVVAVRTPGGMVHLHAEDVVVATGAYEVQPIVPGAHLEGIFTPRAASVLRAEGLLDDDAAAFVALPDEVVRFEGATRVEAVVIRDREGVEHRRPCLAAVVDLGLQARDGLARQRARRVVGDAAISYPLPPAPTIGVVCPCTGTTVADLESVWSRGFHDIELLKRASLVCTGTCQGAVCLPYVRAFVEARAGVVPPPFTARPVSRQPTIAEASAGYRFPATRRTALDGEHRVLGARMERFGGWWRPYTYGDQTTEYWAVRQAVSIMDVGTLGKTLVSGPDAVTFLEQVYPCGIADIAVGRMRYALLLNEAGYVIDDGLVIRLAETRFALTFTTGGGASIDPWLRDWAEAFDVDVRIMDRTVAEGAINVTGPNAAEVLARLGCSELPPYMGFLRGDVAGVPCRILRLGFTGEASFELHHDADRSVTLWRALLEAGEPLGMRPHGLDSLLTLRLEKGHVIVGQDSDFDSTPRRLDMAWAQRMAKPAFVGRHALTRIDELPLDRKLVGITIGGEAPVEGSVLLDRDGVIVGYLTSSRWSPTLRCTVALAWVDLVDGRPPVDLTCEGRAATIAPIPFYDPAGARLRG